MQLNDYPITYGHQSSTTHYTRSTPHQPRKANSLNQYTMSTQKPITTHTTSDQPAFDQARAAASHVTVRAMNELNNPTRRSLLLNTLSLTALSITCMVSKNHNQLYYVVYTLCIHTN